MFGKKSRTLLYCVLLVALVWLVTDGVVVVAQRSDETTNAKGDGNVAHPQGIFHPTNERRSSAVLGRVNKDYHKLISSFGDVALRTEDTMGTEGKCLRTRCAYENQECDGTLFDGTNCTQCCAIGLHCVANRCDQSNFGVVCSSNSECYANCDQNHCTKCISGTCQAVLAAGDQCDSSDFCLGRAECVNGTCVGVPVGGQCSIALGECVFGSFCNNGKCSAALANGAPCNQDYECLPSSVCNQQCVPIWQLPLDSPCVLEANYSSIYFDPCELGLHCENGTCIQNEESQLQTCVQASDCPNNDCVCDPFQGSYYCGTPFEATNSCGAKLQAVLNCTLENECFPIYTEYLHNSCTYVNCNLQVTSMLNCLCPAMSGYYDNCFYFPYGECASQRSRSGLIVSVSFGAVFLMGVAATFAFVWHRRRNAQYEVIV